MKSGEMQAQGSSGGKTYFVADGLVVLQPVNAGDGIIIGNNDDSHSHYTDLVFRNYGRVTTTYKGGMSGLDLVITRCKFAFFSTAKNWFNIENRFSRYANDSIFINLNSESGTHNYYFDRCIFGNCADIHAASIKNSYVGAGATVHIPNAAAIQNCNIQGSINVAGVLYANAGDFNAAFPGRGVMSGDPKFNNESKEDFTLKPDSPHLAAGVGPSHLRLSNSLYLKGPEGAVTGSSGHYFEQAATGAQIPLIAAQNITASLQGDQLRLKVSEGVGGSMVGNFRTAPIRVGDVTQTLNRLGFAAGLNFDTDYPATEAQFDSNNPNPRNNNVPNSHNYVSGAAGRNPNRMEVPMRWSNKDNPQNGVASDWVSGADFLLFEWETDLFYNPVTLIGNGSPDFLTATQTTAENAPKRPDALWVQFEVVLMNNYYSR